MCLVISSNGFSLGSGGTGLDGLGRPCLAVYAAGVVSESLDAALGSGHVGLPADGGEYP